MERERKQSILDGGSWLWGEEEPCRVIHPLSVSGWKGKCGGRDFQGLEEGEGGVRGVTALSSNVLRGCEWKVIPR